MTAPVTSRLVVARTRAELAAARSQLRGPVGLVPTMGALHEGHAALMRHARDTCAGVIVTVFVNPLQFGPGEDFDRYPRTLETDLELCRAEGVDLVFAPDTDEMYPTEPLVRVDPGPLGGRLEGESRPGHFSGVLTVVTKLVTLTRPDRAFFGEKDFQQLALIRRMVRDLDLPVDIVGVPIVRDADGLARSSRNRYLTVEQRRAAAAVPVALAAGQRAARTGATGEQVRAAVLDVLATEPSLRLDRLDLVEADGLTEPLPAGVPGRLLIAVFAGGTRLIDNVHISLED